MENFEIKKIERTDADVDNSVFEIKEAYEVADDFGKVETLYRKETIPVTDYTKLLDEQIETAQNELNRLITKKAEVEKVISPKK